MNKEIFRWQIVSLLTVGVSYVVFTKAVHVEPIPALIWSLAVWMGTLAIHKVVMDGMKPLTDDVSPPGPPDLDTVEGRTRLEVFLTRHGVIGSCNIRDGHVRPVVAPEKLDDLHRTLRAAVLFCINAQPQRTDLHIWQPNGDGTFRDQIIGLTYHQLEQVSGVLERVIEERLSSRRLYRGFGPEEVLRMARTAAAAYVGKQPNGGSDNLILANAISRGQVDDNEFVRAAVQTINLILQIKGNDL